MLKRIGFAAVALVVIFGASAWALEYNAFQVVFVRSGVSTPVILAIGTPEELGNIDFMIVEGPKFGVLLGIPPSLVYIPQPNFYGTDWISFFIVQKLTGQIIDAGTVQLRVLGPAELFSTAFRWEGSITFSGPAFAMDAYRFVFGFYARSDFLDSRAQAVWDMSGFSQFDLTAKIELEGAWPEAWRLPITSTLTFAPTTLSLTSWTVDARTTLLGWNFAYYFYYSGMAPEANSYATFTVDGAIERITFSSRLKYATLTPTFSEWFLTLRGPWLCQDCPIKWELEFVQKKLGFDHLSFTVKNVPIPCPGCGVVQTYMDIKVTFSAEQKSVEPSLGISAGLVVCVRPLLSLLTPSEGFGISGLAIYGVEIRCALPGGYKGRFATSFDPNKDSAVTGYTRFFEVVQLEGPVVPCCGAPGWWQISLYFERGSGKLFGLGMSDVNLYIPISREILVNVRLQTGLVDPSNPAKTWVLTTGWKALF